MTSLQSPSQDLKTFHDLAQRTRAGVLDWLQDLPPSAFTLEHNDFAYGSLSAIYAHIADCYLKWVGTVGLGRGELPGLKVGDVSALREAFTEVDATLAEALKTFSALDERFDWISSTGKTSSLTRRWLVLHPITHEFHHKGQALALARVLGYPHPGKPDTDLVDP